MSMERRHGESLSREGEQSSLPSSVEKSPSGEAQEDIGNWSGARSALPIVVVATFTADGLRQPLLFWTEALDLGGEVTVVPYAQVLQELINPDSLMSRNRSGINVLLIRLQDWLHDSNEESNVDEDLEYFGKIARDLVNSLEGFRRRNSASIFVFLAPSSTTLANDYREGLEWIANCLIERLSTLASVHCWMHADLIRLYPVTDHESLVSDRIGHTPYTDEYFVAIATLLVRRAAGLMRSPYKVIAVGCDNTLWKGICGKDGASGVELTPSHRKFQEMLVRQRDLGMLLCLCSKNNPADVEAVFQNRMDMPLREKHFISSRVNWSAKSSNLESLAQELDLSLERFILVDDSPLECAEVKAHCPTVLALQFPDTSEEIGHFLDHVWAFDRIGVSNEERRRTEQYDENQARSGALLQTTDMAGFQSSLEVAVQISPPRPDQLFRLAELVQRTNQFNLTTIRRRAEEISALLSSAELRGLVVKVSDRFGDYGLTGAILFRIGQSSLEVDTFVLSCQVLGRGVEYHIAHELGKIAGQEKLTSVALKYRPTSRNEPAREFLESAFLEFQVSRGNDTNPSSEIVFVVPPTYAEGLAPKIVAAKVAASEGESRNRPKEKSSSTSSTQWHELAYRLSRVGDILREISRSASRARSARAES